MLIIKGFALNSTFIDNGSDTPAFVGVLSAHSQTYTKEKGFYRNLSISDVLALRTFVTTRDGAKATLSATDSDRILQVMKSTYDYAVANLDQVMTPEKFRVHLVTNHNADIDQLAVGALVKSDGLSVPTFMTFKLRGVEETQVTLWFSDETFQIRFPDTENVSILPVDRMDDFFKEGPVVEAFVKEINSEITVQRMQLARGKYPESYKRVDMFNYYDQVNPGRVIPVPFGMLIYGIAGNNIDTIKEKLQNDILANSSHSRDEWAKIFPEIFRRNEVILAPFWHLVAIPNLANTPTEYSPQVNHKAGLTYIKRFSTGYPNAHVNDHYELTGFPYRSIALGSIGHIENTDNKYSLSTLYPDWINTNTNQDFNRMKPATREWALLAARAIAEAETFTDTSVIPEGFMKVKRGQYLYLTFTVNKVNYLVLCKSSVIS